MIKTVLFDTIGTTVKTENPDFIIDAFKKAFAIYDISVDESFLVQSRGKNKSEVIRQVLKENELSYSLEEKILHVFNEQISQELKSLTEAEGINEVFSFLRNKNIYIGVGTGLSTDIFEQLQHHLNWYRHHLDYIGISEIIGKSRPHPAMIFDMMKKLNIDSPQEVLKVGDTIADIREGKNAGAFTAVILAGTQPESLLVKESPDFIFKELREIVQLPIFNKLSV